MPTGLLYRIAILSVLLSLAACQPATDITSPLQPAEPAITEAEITALIDRAAVSQSPQKEYLLIDAARLLYQQDRLAWARNLLTSIDSQVLETGPFVEYTLLFSQIAWEDDAFFLTQRILTNPRLQRQWQDFSTDAQIQLLQLRAELYSLLGETRPSVVDRLQLQNMLTTPEQQVQNHEALWQTLMTIPLGQLQALSASTTDNQQRGWYELATISKSNQDNLERQQAKINEWMMRWPEHPASIRLPNDLQLLKQLIAERPQQIAMLLPQHGRVEKAGAAIRDGFMASYYQAARQGNQVPNIRFYDTAEGDLLSHYQQAVDDGAEMIIGPLNKDAVSTLNQLESLPVPTLAVNYAEGDDNLHVTAGLYQFGLAVEDEARQAAQRAWREGYRHPLVLTTNASWGQRSANAFIQEWTAMGGKVSDYKNFTGNNDYSSVIESALLVNESNNRANSLRRLFGQSLEFEPRRRQDIDMIFLVAMPIQARQVKPTLAFHYAGELPVYATSHIYSGEIDPKQDRDLNDIKFSTLPWVFQQNDIKTDINKIAKPAPAYQQLYALGVDAFQLYPRLRQLELLPDARFYGVTGALQLHNNRIERQQIWAKMVNGKAEQLPSELGN